MTSRSAPAARPRRAPSAPPARPGLRTARPAAAQRKRERVRRRRRVGLVGLLIAVLLGAGGLLFAGGAFDTAVREITLPLRHEDVIRQQAADKGLDAALVAGVIYTESRFRSDAVSSAGALGLMQITPATAADIARKSGGTLFETGDLATPQVNISYGAYYLRYLLNRFDGNETKAVAAYNGGEGNVERWIAEAEGRGAPFRVAEIPFTETREYVSRVRDAEREYRRTYPSELGL